MTDQGIFPAKFNLGALTLDARPDTVDFRDKMYIPTLIEVPAQRPLKDYQAIGVPILNQGQEGACTGFGLATVANYLLRKRDPVTTPPPPPVSMRMLYEMARKYDEWPGESYSGSSARGAMKGWHKHGVCSHELWPYAAKSTDLTLTNARAEEASRRPLGAYFRVNHKDLVAMHCAISEVGVLYATASVHEGWGRYDSQGVIPFKPEFKKTGGHAFAIVAYDQTGFWIQNSWGKGWGVAGFALITYDDWLQHGTDVWVARLGVPVNITTPQGAVATVSPGAKGSQSYSFFELRPHVVSLGNDGALKPDGTYGTSEADVQAIFRDDIPRITQGWKKKRILLYAHGGLVGETGFLQRVAEYRSTMLKSEVYPLAFVWHTDLWSTLTNLLQDALRQKKPEGLLGDTLDFMLDRLDDTLEPIIRALKGKLVWGEMKENAHLATASQSGGARLVLAELARMVKADRSVEVHIAGHSAGSIFHSLLIQLLTTKGNIPAGELAGSQGYGIPVTTCTMWAPGVTIDEFKQTYLPAIENGGIQHMALYTLTDEAERDDHCGNIYHKSILYLVSNALEEKRQTPLLGLAKDVRADKQVSAVFKDSRHDWVLAPNKAAENSIRASRASKHGEFDDEKLTVKSTLARILQAEHAEQDFEFSRTSASLQDMRKQVERIN